MAKNKKQRVWFKKFKFRIKYGLFYKKITTEEFKLAGEYLENDIDVFTMEKDLLLRGMKFKKVSRIIDAYRYLAWLTNYPEPKLITTEQLKGGILDGIRRS